MDEQQRKDRLEKAVDKAKRQLKVPKLKPEKVVWMGELLPRREIQKDLNGLPPGEKVVLLTENRRGEVYSRLEALTEEERLEDGKALYQENAETLDYDNKDSFEDWEEAHWFSGKWLAALKKHKAQLRYWKAYTDE